MRRTLAGGNNLSALGGEPEERRALGHDKTGFASLSVQSRPRRRSLVTGAAGKMKPLVTHAVKKDLGGAWHKFKGGPLNAAKGGDIKQGRNLLCGS